MWGDWVEDTSSFKTTMYQNIWATARNSSAVVTPAVSTATMGYSVPALGQNGGNCVGAFFFSFGWVWQGSATWINLLNQYPYTYAPQSPLVLGAAMKGNELFEPVAAIYQIYTGSKLPNQPPTIAAPGLMINGMTLDESILVQTGAVNTASLSATSPSGLTLSYTWALLPMPADPTNHTTMAPVPWGVGTASSDGAAPTLRFVAPAVAGGYRLTVWVSDGKGSAAYATCPFYVSPAAAAVSVKADADSMTTDGKLLAAGYFGGVSAYTGLVVQTVTQNNGTSITASVQNSYAPVNSQSSAALAGVGGNTWAYFGFTIPAGTVTSAFGTPSRVLLNVHLEGGSSITQMTGVNVYGVPYTWTEASLTYATSPCNVAGTTLAYGVGSGTQMPGTCKTLVGSLTSSSKSILMGAPVLGPSYSPDDCCDPPGLQLDGNYMRIDVTPYAAPLLATGETSLSFMVAGDGPFPGPMLSLRTKERNPWPAPYYGENAAYLQIWPAGASSTLSASVAVTNAAAAKKARRSLQQASSSGLLPSEMTALQAALAQAVPGTTANNVAISTSGYTVTATITLGAVAAATSYTQAAAAALASALVADLNIAATDVLLGLSAAAVPIGVEVPLVLSGFTLAQWPADSGAGAAAAAAAALAAALSSKSSATAAAVAAYSLGPASLGLLPTLMQQLATTLTLPASSGRRLLQTTPAPATSTLADFVSSGGLSTALRGTCCTAGQNLTVLPGGRASTLKHWFDLKTWEQQLRAVNITTVETAISDDARAIKKQLPLFALAVVAPIAACLLCYATWKRRVSQAEAERDAAVGQRDAAALELQKAQQALRSARQEADAARSISFKTSGNKAESSDENNGFLWGMYGNKQQRRGCVG